MEPNRRGARVADWMRRWNSGLTRFLERRVGTRVDAQDLAQEVYLRLLRAERLDLVIEPQAYLYRVASNVAAEWRIRARQSHPHSTAELESLVEATTPDALIEDAIDRQRFEVALGTLGPMPRAVVFLKLRDGMTHEEIARHLGVTTRMVRRFLSVGYIQLRRALISE